MQGPMKITTADTGRQRWEREVVAPSLEKAPERPVPFTTISGRAIDRLYSSDDLEDFDYARGSMEHTETGTQRRA